MGCENRKNTGYRYGEKGKRGRKLWVKLLEGHCRTCHGRSARKGMNFPYGVTAATRSSEETETRYPTVYLTVRWFLLRTATRGYSAATAVPSAWISLREEARTAFTGRLKIHRCSLKGQTAKY